MRFRATIERSGKTATGIEVPNDVDGAKTAETRQRRIDTSVAQFREGRA